MGKGKRERETTAIVPTLKILNFKKENKIYLLNIDANESEPSNIIEPPTPTTRDKLVKNISRLRPFLFSEPSNLYKFLSHFYLF